MPNKKYLMYALLIVAGAYAGAKLPIFKKLPGM